MAYNPLLPAGQATMANSSPVAIASDQSVIPVSGTFWQTTQPVSLASLPAFASIPTFTIDQTTPGTTNKVYIGTDGTVTISGSISNTSFDATQSTPSSLKNQSHGYVSLAPPTYSDLSVDSLSLTTAGNLRVDGSSVTQPVSGSVSISSGAVTVSQSTATNLKTQAESYQGGTAVSSTNPLYVAQLPVASGGVTAVSGASTGGSTAITIYASPGQVYGWYFYNANSSVAYVHFYNTASAITVGTTAALYVLPIPASSGANVFGIGIYHSSSIKIGISTGRSSGTAVTSAVDYNIFYK